VQLLDARGRLRSLAKNDIRTLTYATTSPMPSYASRLSTDEVADVVAFLASLREP
jgi:mono/diheme cytochrome c family protein